MTISFDDEYESLARMVIAHSAGMALPGPDGELTSIGSGSFGQVFQWKPNPSSRIPACAIKCQEQENLDEEIYRVLSLRDSIYVPKIFRAWVFSPPRRAIISMELLPKDLFDAYIATKKPMHFDEMRFFALQSVQFLADLRKKGWTHGDLKPENCAKTKHGLVKFFDFNHAHKHHTEIGYRFGTGHFSAPEVFYYSRCKDLQSPASDMWGLGCIFYAAVTSNLLFFPEKDARLPIPLQWVKYLGKIPRLFPQPNTEDFPRLHNPNLLFNHIYGIWCRDPNYIEPVIRKKAEQFTDLIKRMLRYDPKERITPEEALNHPFFKVSSVTAVEELPSNVRTLIREFVGEAALAPRKKQKVQEATQ